MSPVLLLALLGTPPAGVLVVPVEPAEAADAVLATSLQAPIESAFEAVPELRVTSARDVKVVLDAQREMQTINGGTNDASQLALLGRVGATFSGDFVLKPELGRTGGDFTLSLTLLRIHDAQSVARFTSGPVPEAALFDQITVGVEAIRAGLLTHVGAAAEVQGEEGPGWAPYALIGVGVGGLGASLGLGFTAIDDESLGRARAADATLWVSAGMVAAGVAWLIYALAE